MGHPLQASIPPEHLSAIQNAVGGRKPPERISLCSPYVFHEARCHSVLCREPAEKLAKAAALMDCDYIGSHPLMVFGFNGPAAVQWQGKLQGMVGECHHYQRAADGTYQPVEVESVGAVTLAEVPELARQVFDHAGVYVTAR